MGWTSFHDRQTGLSLLYPKDWKASRTSGVIEVRATAPADDGAFARLAVGPSLPGMSPARAVPILAAPAESRFQPRTSGSLGTADLPAGTAVLVTFEGKDVVDGVVKQVRVYLLLQPDRTVVLTLASAPKAAAGLRRVLDRIAGSLQAGAG